MGDHRNKRNVEPKDRSDRPADAKSWSPDTWEKYSRSGLGAKVGFGKKPAVLVIDMSKAFNDPAYGVGGDQTEAVKAIAGLLPVARRLGALVVFTTMAFLPDGSDLGMFGKKIPALAQLRLDDPAAVTIDDRIAPVLGEFVINKKCASAFFGTNLLPLLVKNRIDTLIVTGCSTSGCIRATVIDGASNGFHVIVPQECVSDRAEAPHLANLFDIEAKYGDVVPSSEVINYLEKLIAKKNRA